MEGETEYVKMDYLGDQLEDLIMYIAWGFRCLELRMTLLENVSGIDCFDLVLFVKGRSCLVVVGTLDDDAQGMLRFGVMASKL